MKPTNKQRTSSHRKVTAWLAAFVFLLTLTQCKQPGEEKSPYEAVAVNPAFTTNPPVANKVTVTELSTKEGEANLLIEATLPTDRIKENVLALLVDDSTRVVMHDDGKSGDKTAGDGIFSTVMNTDTEGLKEFIAGRAVLAKQLLADRKMPVYKFQGRLEFPADEATIANVRTLATLTEKGKINLKDRLSLVNTVNLHLLFDVPEAFKKTALTVTDLSVVTDPSRTFNPCTGAGTAGGAWTFGKLMTDMAAGSGITPANFVLNWLNTWTVDQSVNSDPIPKRVGINNIINTWHTLSGGPAAPLDINKAPFQLIAIVNRFDLMTGGGGYGGGNAGEGRFVFAATGTTCNASLPGFLVIFEYGVNKSGCSAIHGYAREWVNLASMPFPSPAYNAALQHITDQFAKANTNPSKPNGSSLNQLRTNEVNLSTPWELREFNISATTHQLFNVTTKREPQKSFNSQLTTQLGVPTPANVIELGKFVNDPANMRDIINDKKDLPLTVATSIPFLAGKAHDPDPPGVLSYHWDAVVAAGTGHIDNDTARFHISLNTCSGCHGGETQTQFKQIDPISTPATLSRFLTGDPAFSSSPFLVTDLAGRPSGSPIRWPFNDLENRGRILLNFDAEKCLTLNHGPILVNQRVPIGVPVELIRRLTFNPITMTD